ncbi:MAG: hypothetical protein RMK18_03845 [Armatimonadota bacterium]|nr:hypothetical protein [Armatimonadota bacterium]MDW8024982.1 hypothetical protein [Armatimonadota bacterium]
MTLYLFAAAIVVSLWHAMMPTHWLPFVLAGKAHRWDRLKLLTVTLLTGVCHAASTLALGFVVWFVGRGIVIFFSSVAKYIVALVLLFVGVAYVVNALFSSSHDDRFTGILNQPGAGKGEHQHPCNSEPEKAEWLIIGVLLLVPTLSPCQAILPLFFAAAAHGFESLIVLMLLTGTVTILAMMAMVMLASFGLELLRLQISERLERAIIGLLFIALIPFVLHH